MALGYLLNPALQVEDADGKPLVSGFIRIYRHGTTEPIATYKDFTGDLNPIDIVLNNKGMCVILVDPNYLYDAYCYDSHGVEQWSRLNVGCYGGSGDGRYYVVESTDNSVDVTSSTDPVTSETTIDLSVQHSLDNYKLLQAPVDQSYADYGFVKSLKQTANGNVTLECSYISAATSSTTGLMSSTDKSKLDNIQSGAEVNQNAFSNLKVGNTTIAADSKTDTLELVAGGNITLTPNANDDSLTISATDTTYVAGTGIAINGNTINCTVDGGSQICTQNNGQAGIVEHPVSKLSLDTDFQQILADGNDIGVFAPTPAIAATDKVLTVPAGSDAPLWMDTPSNAEFIQFTYGNTTTAQDAVYAAIAAAYAADKLPVLTCAVAGGSLYWFPTATGSVGYSFARHTSDTCYTATFDHVQHILSVAQKSIVDYTAGTNVSIDANHVITATDTTYTAGSGIAINSSNVISNTMHQDTYGLMISYNTLGNSGSTTHSIGPWRIKVDKAAMAAWDSVTGATSLHIAFAHEDYLDGSIVNGRILVDTLTPWADGTFSTVYTAHNQWGFVGTYAQGGSNEGFGLQLISPGADPDGNARACPKTMRGYHFTVNCGINGPDWLECDASLLYINNNTSLTSNAARLLLRFKYFYV